MRKKKRESNDKLEQGSFDKYYYYQKSVQGPEGDVIFLKDTYKELRKKSPRTMCEDFCGTFSISCEWVKLGSEFKAVSVDIDSDPIEYGRQNYLSLLNEDEKSRIQVFVSSVLDKALPKVDIVSAMNFSYFLFKKRSELKAYFASAYSRINNDGIFLVDCFGGSQCQQSIEEETEHKEEKFSYFWDQDSFNPVTNEAQFYIHFKRKGEKKREKVFSYDWRMWSISEIREVMEEVGFSKTYVYWEGTTKDGDGDGKFVQTQVGEECEAWISYIVAKK